MRIVVIILMRMRILMRTMTMTLKRVRIPMLMVMVMVTRTRVRLGTWKVSSWRSALVVSNPRSKINSWLLAFSGPWRCWWW